MFVCTDRLLPAPMKGHVRLTGLRVGKAEDMSVCRKEGGWRRRRIRSPYPTPTHLKLQFFLLSEENRAGICKFPVLRYFAQMIAIAWGLEGSHAVTWNLFIWLKMTLTVWNSVIHFLWWEGRLSKRNLGGLQFFLVKGQMFVQTLLFQISHFCSFATPQNPWKSCNSAVQGLFLDQNLLFQRLSSLISEKFYSCLTKGDPENYCAASKVITISIISQSDRDLSQYPCNFR